MIIRLSSIGDILQASAVPRVLRKRFPTAEIHWLVRSDNVELVGYNPHLTKVISFDRNTGFKGFKKLAEELQKQGYTHIYDAHANLRSFYFCSKVKSEHFLRRHKPRFKRFALFWMRINLFKGYNSVESFIQPLEEWGVKNDGQGSELHLPTATTQKIRSLLNDFSKSGEKSFVALAPSAAWEKKRWPLPCWIELATMILTQTDLNIAIIGGKEDGFCRQITDIAPTRILHLQGKLTLLESAAAAALCNTLVANDTGILHMAEALGQNVIALIGPTPFGYPVRMQSAVLETRLWCKPCSKDGRGPCINPVYQKCLKSISPRAVFKKLPFLFEKPEGGR